MQNILTGFQVKNIESGYVEMITDGQIVVMGEDDRFINATQILKLTQKNRSQRDIITKNLRKNGEVANRPARGTHGRENTWISIQRGKKALHRTWTAREVAASVRLRICSATEQIQFATGISPLHVMDRLTSIESLVGLEHSSQISVDDLETSSFVRIFYQSGSIIVRKPDWRIDCTQVANRATKIHAIEDLKRNLHTDLYDLVRGVPQYRWGT